MFLGYLGHRIPNEIMMMIADENVDGNVGVHPVDQSKEIDGFDSE